MKLSTGKTLFTLTSEDEGLCMKELKNYFEQMYFAN